MTTLALTLVMRDHISSQLMLLMPLLATKVFHSLIKSRIDNVCLSFFLSFVISPSRPLALLIFPDLKSALQQTAREYGRDDGLQDDEILRVATPPHRH